MPKCAQVFIHYGIYDSCGIVDHRTHRLDGLKNVLQKNDHSVTFVEINDRNAVEIWVKGELVFKTDIRDLDYGGDGELDALCTEALQRVNEAF